ncbi:MAG: thiamine pyrophosphate-binding protein [Bryobacterales bacterium]|nr:thiamine pyrophosphate-binding protein [Bryobacteraceae bacterium]MDW8130110.1 thiamine pyrophosphate-binding protein [Bryobacterales bacterium]
MTAVEWFLEALKQRGVRWVATLCGHGLDPLYNAARRVGLRLIDTRNEQTAAYMAVSAGRLTRQPAVAAVSSGVAHAIALAGVADAFMDGAPMLLVSGAAAVRTRGMGHFQDLDQVTLAAPVSRYARYVDCAERVLEILDEAWRAALEGPGPAHVTFPMDVQSAEVEPDQLVRPPWRPPRRARLGDPGEVARLLADAERPLVVAGSGVYYAGEAEPLTEFCERFAIPFVIPIWDRGCAERRLRSFMGVIGALTGGPRLLADADCVVMAGAVPDYRVGYLQPGSVAPDLRVGFLSEGWREVGPLYERSGGRAHEAWREEAARRRDRFRRSVWECGERQSGGRTHAVHILRALAEVLTDQTVLLIDGGSIGQWAHHLLCDRYPGHWLTCGRSGVVGWGIAGAMAARVTFPDRPVVLLAGDGAFTFAVAELECAVRQGLPFVAIVADDQGWGITRAGHLEKFGEPIASALGPVDFAKLAEALGARGLRLEAPGAIASALRSALEAAAVTVLHVPIAGGNPAGA